MPDEGLTGWDDAIKGRIEFPSVELEDLVLVRSDGRPTYNFASPLEDWLDGITHVIRGDDHVSNTPKQIHILRALGAELPTYAHVPNVFGPDGRKLSKRHGAVSVDEFRDAGYVPEALMNFLALLGWAPDGETTIMRARRARRAVHARARRIEPGDVRPRQARLDERRVPARSLPRSGPARRVPRRTGSRLGRRSARRRRSCRRRSPASGSSGLRRLPLPRHRGGPWASRHAHPRGGRRSAGRSLDGSRDRVDAEAPLRRAGREASGRVLPIRVAVTAHVSHLACTRASSSWARAFARSNRSRWTRDMSAHGDLVGLELGPTSARGDAGADRRLCCGDG